MKTKKMLCAVVMVMMLAIMFTVPAFAAGTGDVAGAIEGTWTDASAQIKTVVNNVVFPVIDLVLAVFFFAKLGMAYLTIESTASSNGLRRPSCLPALSSP